MIQTNLANVCLAVGTQVRVRAVTGVVCDQVCTCAVVLAWV